jgi:sulfate permease, SulP family
VRVDPNQDLFALGIANLASMLTSGFPVAGALGRTSIASDSGARTPLS